METMRLKNECMGTACVIGCQNNELTTNMLIIDHDCTYVCNGSGCTNLGGMPLTHLRTVYLGTPLDIGEECELVLVDFAIEDDK